MYQAFNAKFPLMRPLKNEVYSKLIFLAGVENEHLREQVYNAGARDILVSYYYLRNKGKEAVREQLKRFDNVILDSGGYTMIQQMKAGSKIPDDVIRNYTEEYLRYAIDMADCFNWVFEMDMAMQIGQEYWQAHLDELQDNGVRVVPIVHPDRVEDIDRLGFYNYDLVAFSGGMTGGKYGSHMQVLNKFAKKNILVHGLAATDEASINRVAYFSVDSSSWVSGAKYGLTFVFTSNRLTTYDASRKEAVRKANKQKFIEAGLDWEGIEQDKAPAVNTMNAFAWVEWINYRKYNSILSYWLTDLEKAEAKDFLKSQTGQETEVTAVERVGSVLRSPQMVQNNRVISTDPRLPYMLPSMLEPLRCDACNVYENCPEYKSGETCAYATTVGVKDIKDVIGIMGSLVSMQHSRVGFAVLQEKLRGGDLDPQVSKELTVAFKMSQTVQKTLESPLIDPLATNPGGGKEEGDGDILEAMFEAVDEQSDRLDPVANAKEIRLEDGGTSLFA